MHQEINKSNCLNKYPVVRWSNRKRHYGKIIYSKNHIQGVDGKTVCGITPPRKANYSPVASTFQRATCAKCLKIKNKEGK